MIGLTMTFSYTCVIKHSSQLVISSPPSLSYVPKFVTGSLPSPR